MNIDRLAEARARRADAAEAFANILYRSFAPATQRRVALITSVARDGAGRATAATGSIDGVGNQIVQISYGMEMSAGDAWYVVNHGRLSVPYWVAERRLAAAPVVPTVDPNISLPTPTGLELATQLITPLPGGITQAEIYVKWTTIGHQYGHMRYEVECYPNDFTVQAVNLFVIDELPDTTLENAIDNSDTTIPRDENQDSPINLNDFPRAGRLRIENEYADHTAVTAGTGDSGSGGTGGSGTFYVSGESWTVDEWVDYALTDSAGDHFHITSNSADTLYLAAGTPASGDWEINPAFTGCTRGVGGTSAVSHSAGVGIAALSVSATLSPLPMDTEYNVRVRSHSTTGAVSTWTAWSSITTSGPEDLLEGGNLLANADFEVYDGNGSEGWEPRFWEGSECQWGSGATLAWTPAMGYQSTHALLWTLPDDAGGYIQFPEGSPIAMPQSEVGQPYTASIYIKTSVAASNISTEWTWPFTGCGKLLLLVFPADDSGLAIAKMDAELRQYMFPLQNNWYRLERTCRSEIASRDLAWKLFAYNDTGAQVQIYVDRPQLEQGHRATAWRPGTAGGGSAVISVDPYVLQVSYDNLARITLDAEQTSLAVGQDSEDITYAVGDGIWMGRDSGVYKFRVGQIGGERMFWNGTFFAICADTNNYLRTDGTSLQFYSNSTKVLELTNTPAVFVGSQAAEYVEVTSANGIRMMDYDGGSPKCRGQWATAGHVLFGSDISAAASTAMIVSAADSYTPFTTTLMENDILIGHDVTNKAFLFWDASEGRLYFTAEGGDSRLADSGFQFEATANIGIVWKTSSFASDLAQIRYEPSGDGMFRLVSGGDGKATYYPEFAIQQERYTTSLQYRVPFRVEPTTSGSPNTRRIGMWESSPLAAVHISNAGSVGDGLSAEDIPVLYLDQDYTGGSNQPVLVMDQAGAEKIIFEAIGPTTGSAPTIETSEATYFAKAMKVSIGGTVCYINGYTYS